MSITCISTHIHTHMHTHTPLIFWGLTVQPASSHSFSVVKTYTVVIGEVHVLFSNQGMTSTKGRCLAFLPYSTHSDNIIKV